MTTILIISDTHGWLDPMIRKHLDGCDELWHAGDIGNTETLFKLESMCKSANCKLRIVYGNIDGHELRRAVKDKTLFRVEGMRIAMLHIGGKPPRYAKGVRQFLSELQPNIFVCGHSHILNVMNDNQLHCFYINPGACGNHGFHQVNTMIKMTIHETIISSMNVIEWPRNTHKKYLTANK